MSVPALSSEPGSAPSESVLEPSFPERIHTCRMCVLFMWHP